MALASMFPRGQAIRVSFGVSGLPDLLHQLERLRKHSPSQCAKAVKELATDIQSEARRNITAQGAVDTGITRANIHQWSEDGYRTAFIGVSASRVSVTHRQVGNRLFIRDNKSKIALIAAIIEFGHGVIRPVKAKMLHWFDKAGNEIWARKVGPVPPRPFLHPAFEANVRDAATRIRDSILSTIRRVP